MFRHLYQGALGEQVSLADAYRWAAAITRRYHDDGYLFARAELTAAELGRVVLRVTEGKVGTVRVEGPRPGSRLADRMAAHIADSSVANIREIERTVLLINDLPGTSARAVLQPGEANALDVVIVTSDLPDQSSLSFDNYGSRYLGPYETSAQAAVSNLLPYEQTTFGVLASVPFEELQSAQLGHSIPVDSSGTLASIKHAAARSAPGFRLAQNHIRSDSDTLQIAISHPLIRSRKENLSLSAELAAKDITTEVLGSPLTDDRLRILAVSLGYDRIDASGSNQAQLSLRQGLGILDASESGDNNLSRVAGHPDYTAVAASFGRVQGLTERVSLYTAATGQYAFSPLLSSEQFGYGGQQFGRGYDSSEFTADDGFAGLVEVRYALPQGAPSASGQVFAFGDLGRIWNYEGVDRSTTAASVGTGVRFTLGANSSGQLTLAEPLLRPAGAPGFGSGYGPRMFFSLNYRF